METGAIGVPGTPARNPVDLGKEAEPGNVTTRPPLIMDMIVTDKAMSMKFAILTHAQVRNYKNFKMRKFFNLKSFSVFS